MRLLLTLIFSIGYFALHAQYVPTPAPPQSQAVVIKGAKAHLGNGQVLENSIIAFSEGKLTFVGAADSAPAFPGHREIDASGQEIYPGLDPWIGSRKDIDVIIVTSYNCTEDCEIRLL